MATKNTSNWDNYDYLEYTFSAVIISMGILLLVSDMFDLSLLFFNQCFLIPVSFSIEIYMQKQTCKSNEQGVLWRYEFMKFLLVC